MVHYGHWGYNYQGVLGDGTTTNRSSPVQIGALTNWDTIILTGAFSILALKTDSTIWSWGFNNQGVLGLNNATHYSSPVQIGALTDWSFIGGAGATAGAINSSGKLFTWGDGSNGKLGNGATTDTSSPAQVGALTDWATLGLGSNYMEATKTDNSLWTWGQNGNGELGDGTTVSKSSPVQVGSDLDWKNHDHNIGLSNARLRLPA
jgi:alpha-tubulin suppressor-like RCC1 family protein